MVLLHKKGSLEFYVRNTVNIRTNSQGPTTKYLGRISSAVHKPGTGFLVQVGHYKFFPQTPVLQVTLEHFCDTLKCFNVSDFVELNGKLICVTYAENKLVSFGSVQEFIRVDDWLIESSCERFGQEKAPLIRYDYSKEALSRRNCQEHVPLGLALRLICNDPSLPIDEYGYALGLDMRSEYVCGRGGEWYKEIFQPLPNGTINICSGGVNFDEKSNSYFPGLLTVISTLKNTVLGNWYTLRELMFKNPHAIAQIGIHPNAADTVLNTRMCVPKYDEGKVYPTGQFITGLRQDVCGRNDVRASRGAIFDGPVLPGALSLVPEIEGEGRLSLGFGGELTFSE